MPYATRGGHIDRALLFAQHDVLVHAAFIALALCSPYESRDTLVEHAQAVQCFIR